MTRARDLAKKAKKIKVNSDYRTVQPVDLQKVRKFFMARGWPVVELRQPWRHVWGRMQRGGKTYFLKMACTLAVGERTRNEVSWNQQIRRQLQRAGVNLFTVPKVEQVGRWGELFYFLAEYYEPLFLAQKHPPRTKLLATGDWLDKIVRANLFLLNLSGLKLWRDRDRNARSFADTWEEYWQKILTWYAPVKKYHLTAVLAEARQLKKTYQPAVCHGDFVPWHMLAATAAGWSDQKFVLVDGEHASSYAPRYYDVAYFYHRLYTSGAAPSEAKKYLQMIYVALPTKERQHFWRVFHPVLATRIIGGFWDAHNDHVINFFWHQQLKKDFCRDQLI